MEKEKDLSLTPPLCWVGGKTKSTSTIVSKIPEHKTYIEPFVGGGSVFFKKPLAEKNVINDNNPELINFYRKLRDGDCKKLQKCELPTNKTEFKKALKRKKNVCGFLKVNRRSYGCNMSSFSPGNVPKDNPKEGRMGNIKKDCEMYKKKLKKTKITNEDYRKSFKKHDSNGTFSYMDPPYVDAYNPSAWSKEKINPKDVCKLAKEAKGKVMISYEDHPEVRKSCKGLKIKKIDNIYGMKDTNIRKREKVKELLITNY